MVRATSIYGVVIKWENADRTYHYKDYYEVVEEGSARVLGIIPYEGWVIQYE